MHSITCTWREISPAPKLSQRFLTTPRLDLVLVLALDMVIMWSDLTSRPRSSHTCLNMTTISEPESSTPRIDQLVLMTLASSAQIGTKWCVTTQPLSLQRTFSPNAHCRDWCISTVVFPFSDTFYDLPVALILPSRPSIPRPDASAKDQCMNY